jgi:hypothetical protein
VEAQPLPVTDVETVRYVGRDDIDRRDTVFDEATHTWSVGGTQARVLIAADGTVPPAVAGRAMGLQPYLGVAVHGVPNYFLLTGPDVAAQKAYVAKCLVYLSRTDSTRIEVRASAQRFYNDRSRGRRHDRHRRGHYWRRVGRRIPSAFDIDSLADPLGEGDGYSGPAEVLIGGVRHDTHVRLSGRLDPIDGKYHWQGTLFDSGFEARMPEDVVVVIADREAGARLTERTPWSTYSVVGVGTPPFALDPVELEIPRL